MKTHKQASQSSSSHIKIIQKNKKGLYNYEVLDSYECGIILLGPEVKSIKANNVQFNDSFARIKNTQLTLHNLYISPYKYYQGESIDPIRIRPLLCHKEEIKKITRAVQEKGRTLIPITLYLKRGLIKVELGICRGKKLYDKKEAIKQKDIDRNTQRELKSFMR